MKIKIVLDNDVRLAWPTPIFSRKWPDTREMNKALLKIIHKKERRSKGIIKSVEGGWHSADDVHSWNYPEVKRLLGFIREAVTELMKVSTGLSTEEYHAKAAYIAWANVLRSGGYHKIHTHPGTAWSGVYYIKAGLDNPDDAPEDAGCIEFYDPRHGVEMVPVPGNPFGQRLWFPPEDGRLFCFPGWLRHMVHPYRGATERVTIGFNVLIEKFETFD